jgi:hypothetical protein
MSFVLIVKEESMSNKSFRIPFLLGVLVFAAITWLVPMQDGVAQVVKAKEPQSLSDEQLAASIVTLRSVKVTLEAADHDYGGHRAAAVRDVKAATHQLHLALDFVRKGKTVPKNTTKDPKGGNEPQALSDAQLAAAIPVLKQTHALLKHADHDYGGHRAKAVIELHGAITQLETALKYSKAKNQQKP